MTVYRYVVPEVYHCDNHTPGEVFTVRLTGDVAQQPDWFTVENIYSGDQFPVQMSELQEIPVQHTVQSSAEGRNNLAGDVMVCAHHSSVHDGVNVEIEAPAGTRITVHVNDGRVVDTVVPE